jgi:ABC-type branched-subunit amino acid transport system substrate-binding protein
MRRSIAIVRLALLCAVLAGCALTRRELLPHNTQPMVKLGLVAPFERRYRTLGYEVLHAVKWALRERNDRGGVAGVMVELVALNDDADPASSAFQAHKLAVDPDIVGVVGPFTEDALLAAAPVYEELGLAAVTPATCFPPIASRLDGVFCYGGGVDVLAEVLLGRLPKEMQVTLLKSGDGPLGDRLSSTVKHAIEVPLQKADLGEMVRQPADLYLYDGDVLDAAEALIQMRRVEIESALWGGPSLARTQLPQIADRAASGACYTISAPLFADLSPYWESAEGTPGPWAALAYDVTRLLLDAIERDVLAEGRATREGVRAQLGEAVGPGGQPVFVQEQRRQTEVVFYCYHTGDAYPGRISESR